MEGLYSEAQVGLNWEDQTERSWDKVLPVNGASEATAKVQEVVERGHGWVYLWGGYGSSKTLLLKTAVAECLRTQLEACYIRMVDLLDNLRQSYDQEHQNQAIAAQVRRYTELPLLALDEVDRFKETDWTRERVFQLIDGRYNAAQIKRSVTLLASNNPPDELDGYFASRISDARFAVVHLEGKDLRGGMKKGGN